MNKIILIAAFLALTTINASAAEQCTKDFPYHFVTADGTFGLYQGVGGAWWYPCSVSTTKNGVTPESCKSALDTYLIAKERGRPITLRFEGSCAQLSSTTSTHQGFAWFGVYW